MKAHSQIEPVSTEHLLAFLGLAIDEARQARLLIQSKDSSNMLKEESLLSDTLSHLDQEIDYLEREIAQVRGRENWD